MDEKRGGWNRGNAHNVVYISRQLRAGKHPEDLGAKYLGGGAQNTAYKITIREVGSHEESEIVIKSYVKGYINARKPTVQMLKPFGARTPETQRAKEWVIQEKVKPLANVWGLDKEIEDRYRALNAKLGRKSKYQYDLHQANVGLAEDGNTLVVFDW